MNLISKHLSNTCFHKGISCKVILFVGLFGILNISCTSMGTYGGYGSFYEYCNQAIGYDPNCTYNNMHSDIAHDLLIHNAIHDLKHHRRHKKYKRHKAFRHSPIHKRRHKRRHTDFGHDSIHKRMHRPFGHDSIHKRMHRPPFRHDPIHKRMHRPPPGHDPIRHGANSGGTNSFHTPPAIKIDPPRIKPPSFSEPLRPNPIFSPPPPIRPPSPSLPSSSPMVPSWRDM